MTRILGFRVISLFGLVFTLLLVIDDVRRVPFFCPFESGCAAVTASPSGRPLGIPLSLWGLGAFGGFFLLTLLSVTGVDRWLGRAAVAAGMAGLSLVGIQLFVLRQICRLCLLVDATAILLAAVALWMPYRARDVPEGRGLRLIWAAVASIAVAWPVAWAAWQPPPAVPVEVRRTWVVGKINVVEITDFTCPFCRKNHEVMKEIRNRRLEGVHWVRFFAPSPRNEAATTAARLYLCAARQDAGERMADILFAIDDVAGKDPRELAAEAKLDLDRFEADWKDETIPREVAATRKWVEQSALHGLPQVWVQSNLLLGEQTPETVSAALELAKRSL